MVRPKINYPQKRLKLVAPVDETVKSMAREIAAAYYDNNEAEAVRQAVRESYARMKVALAAAVNQTTKETNGEPINT